MSYAALMALVLVYTGEQYVLDVGAAGLWWPLGRKTSVVSLLVQFFA